MTNKRKFMAIMCRKNTTLEDAMSVDGAKFERAGTDGIVEGFYVSEDNFFTYKFSDRYISLYRRTLRDDGNIWRVYQVFDFKNPEFLGTIDAEHGFLYVQR